MENYNIQACEQGSGSKQLGKDICEEKQAPITTEAVESLTITEPSNEENQNSEENCGPADQISTLKEAMKKTVDDDESDDFKVQNQNSQENFGLDQISTLEEAMQKLVHVELEGFDDDDDDESDRFEKNQNWQVRFGPLDQISTLEEAMQKLVHVELEGVGDDDESDHLKKNQSSHEKPGAVDEISALEDAIRKLVHAEFNRVDDEDNKRGHFIHGRLWKRPFRDVLLHVAELLSRTKRRKYSR